MDNTATVDRLNYRDGHLNVTLAGSWKLSDGLKNFSDDLAGKTSGSVLSVQFQADSLADWDSSLLVYLQQVADYAESTGIEFQGSSLPDSLRELLELARAVPEVETTRGVKKINPLVQLGTSTVGLFEEFGTFIQFGARGIGVFAQLLTRRRKFRWREIWPIIQKTGPGALGLVTLIAFMIGAILAFLGYYVLAQFGASIYVVYIVGYGVLREMGPLMTAIIIAGRTGAAFAAEIGSMKANEELDAYSTMGIDPFDIVVMPRLLALFFMMPVLTIYADAVGIFGGMLISLLLSDLTLELFVEKFTNDINLFQFGIGIFKAVLFGIVVGLAGCLRGMQSGKSADAVGQATTSAVVTGITLIIASNFLIDFVITILGL
jgi:phospholipid/cholesterol/gamma-HCH transport system permease protein